MSRKGEPSKTHRKIFKEQFNLEKIKLALPQDADLICNILNETGYSILLKEMLNNLNGTSLQGERAGRNTFKNHYHVNEGLCADNPSETLSNMLVAIFNCFKSVDLTQNSMFVKGKANLLSDLGWNEYRNLGFKELFSSDAQSFSSWNETSNNVKSLFIIMVLIWVFVQFKKVHGVSLTFKYFLDANTDAYAAQVKEDFGIFLDKAAQEFAKSDSHCGNIQGAMNATNLLTIAWRAYDSSKNFNSSSTLDVGVTANTFTNMIHSINKHFEKSNEYTMVNIVSAWLNRVADSQTPVDDMKKAIFDIRRDYFTDKNGNKKPIDCIYDPFHGWGGRLVVFLALAHIIHTTKIIGNDINQHLKPCYSQLFDVIKNVLEQKGLPVPTAEFYALDAKDAPVPAHSVDLVLTSPPYTDMMFYQTKPLITSSVLVDVTRKVLDTLKPNTGVACFWVSGETLKGLVEGLDFRPDSSGMFKSRWSANFNLQLMPPVGNVKKQGLFVPLEQSNLVIKVLDAVLNPRLGIADSVVEEASVVKKDSLVEKRKRTGSDSPGCG
jgi:hypothetical protein